MWEGVFRLACPNLLYLSLLTILCQSFSQPKPSAGFLLWSPSIGWEGVIPFLASFPRESICAFACPALIITEHIDHLHAKPKERSCCHSMPTSHTKNRQLGRGKRNTSDVPKAVGDFHQAWETQHTDSRQTSCLQAVIFHMQNVSAASGWKLSHQFINQGPCYRLHSASRRVDVKQYSAGGVSLLGLSQWKPNIREPL